jgi:hypothetical protein
LVFIEDYDMGVGVRGEVGEIGVRPGSDPNFG